MSHHDQRVLMERVSILEERVHSYRAHCFALQKELNSANEKIDQLVGLGLDRGLRGRDFIEWAHKNGCTFADENDKQIGEPMLPENVNRIMQ